MSARKTGVTITTSEAFGFIKAIGDELRWFYHVADSDIKDPFPIGTQVEFTPEYTKGGKHLRAVKVVAI